MIRSHSSYPATVLAILLIGGMLVAQEATPTYKMPPKAIADLVDAPLTPQVSVDPNGRWMLLMEQVDLPSIAELSQRELRIAGMRINPRINGMSRTRPYSGLKLMNIEDGTDSMFTGMPDDPRVLDVSWSPDGKHVAFTLTRDTGIELWVADPETGRAKRVSDAKLNGAYRGSPYY